MLRDVLKLHKHKHVLAGISVVYDEHHERGEGSSKGCTQVPAALAHALAVPAWLCLLNLHFED